MAAPPDDPATERSTWHALSADAVAERLGVRPELGLDDAEVARRIARHGANRLPEAPPRASWRIFFSQFESALILVLILAAGLAASIGEARDAIAILTVVVLNAVVGFYQEHRAEQSLAALKQMLPARARVRRSGTVLEIPAAAVVPGDVVLLEPGDRVPADGRVRLAVGLAIDESTLTGESEPVEKSREPVAAGAELGERSALAHMNTMVTKGRGEILVTETGLRTEVGRISLALASAPETRSPLQEQLDQLGKRLGAVAIALVSVLFVMELARGVPLVDVVLQSIALAVAAVPEGLPVVVTVALALGMHRMAQQRAIVKRLASVETLGCTTVICSDKTGTLTLNQMTVRAFAHRGRRHRVDGESATGRVAIAGEDGSSATPDLQAFLVPLVACNDCRIVQDRIVGDPMEGALRVLVQKAGASPEEIERDHPRIAEIPFDAAHRFMATFHAEGDAVRIFVKGAPDVLQRHCACALGPDGEVPFDDDVRERLGSDYLAFAERGLRGLLIATRVVPRSALTAETDLFSLATDLVYVGLVGLQDPPRPEAKGAIALCRRAGIGVKMITGDHPDTALAIARELGLEGEALTGAEIDRLDEAHLAERIERVTVFARVAPAHKVRIVRALKARGHVVAMTGDGVNDAPALKSAHIGIAMGVTGTEVAKEAASMVLTDDDFSTIVSAVRQGRTLYDNIVKFVRFQLSTTMGALLTVFFAPILGLPDPFHPIQILWVAMIMDGPPAVSLALDAARPGIMREPPRKRSEPILPLRRLLVVLGLGAIMTIGTLGVLHWELAGGEAARASTLAFTTFVLFQIFNVFNARAERGSTFHRSFFANGMLWGSIAGVTALQAMVVHWAPAQAVFHTTDLQPREWGIAIGVASSILVLEEARKLLLRLRGAGPSALAPAENPETLASRVSQSPAA